MPDAALLEVDGTAFNVPELRCSNTLAAIHLRIVERPPCLLSYSRASTAVPQKNECVCAALEDSRAARKPAKLEAWCAPGIGIAGWLPPQARSRLPVMHLHEWTQGVRLDC